MVDIKQHDLTVCGRIIGKCTGWYLCEGFGEVLDILVYDFEPGEGYQGPIADCISIDFEAGTIEVYDENGERLQTEDLIQSIRACQVPD